MLVSPSNIIRWLNAIFCLTSLMFPHWVLNFARSEWLKTWTHSKLLVFQFTMLNYRRKCYNSPTIHPYWNFPEPLSFRTKTRKSRNKLQSRSRHFLFILFSLAIGKWVVKAIMIVLPGIVVPDGTNHHGCHSPSWLAFRVKIDWTDHPKHSPIHHNAAIFRRTPTKLVISFWFSYGIC